jgi:hypothetical protein
MFGECGNRRGRGLPLSPVPRRDDKLIMLSEIDTVPGLTGAESPLLWLMFSGPSPAPRPSCVGKVLLRPPSVLT